MNVYLLDKNARVPTRGSAEAAGYDLCAVHDGVIDPGARLLVGTGIAIEIPSGTYGRIAPRSGLALNYGVHIGAGVVDRDYRGEVRVLVWNLGTDRYEFKRGDRIAQLILEKIETPDVHVISSQSTTGRGTGGFGSTGTQ